MNNLTVDAGQMAVFNCHIDFSCMVTTIHWFHAPENSSSSLIKTARSPGDPHVHLIRSADPSHSGTYSCVAQNVLGQSMVAAHLTVNPPQPSSANSIHLKNQKAQTLFLVHFLFFALTHECIFQGFSPQDLVLL